jgi:hypothetical protein
MTLATVAAACDVPDTQVVVANHYTAATTNVVFLAQWENVTFTTPLAPGDASVPQAALQATANTAYVVLAPGFDPSSGATPTKLVLLESKTGFAVGLGDTVTIPVDDTTFLGNCAVHSTLPQADADFMTQRVFQATFTGLRYDAATCKTMAGP